MWREIGIENALSHHLCVCVHHLQKPKTKNQGSSSSSAPMRPASRSSTAAARRAMLTQAASLSSRNVAAEASATAEAEVVQGWPAPAVSEANVVADLETVLQERDACGVSIDLPMGQSSIGSSWP